jgi:hypothetical protein
VGTVSDRAATAVLSWCRQRPPPPCLRDLVDLACCSNNRRDISHIGSGLSINTRCRTGRPMIAVMPDRRMGGRWSSPGGPAARNSSAETALMAPPRGRFQPRRPDSCSGRRRTYVRVSRERVRGIEPPFRAWEARVLPLNYTRGAARRGRAPAAEGTRPRIAPAMCGPARVLARASPRPCHPPPSAPVRAVTAAT